MWKVSDELLVRYPQLREYVEDGGDIRGLYDFLFSLDLGESESLAILGELLDLRFCSSLEGYVPEERFTERVSLDMAKRYGAIVLRGEVGGWILASYRLLEDVVVDELSCVVGLGLELVLAPEGEVLAKIHQGYSASAQSADIVLEEEFRDLNLERLSREIREEEDIMDVAHRAPIVKLVNSILFNALKQRASDVHLQPHERGVYVRYRIDGMLYHRMEIPKELQDAVICRVKIMGNMDIAERRLPQDGGASLTASGRMVDVRISTLPSAYGERVVFRLQDKGSGLYDLSQIGLDGVQLERVERLISHSHGIILVTGPTGSGKTTTLYACLRRINTPEKNIITIEDPVEYLLEGISQIQVSVKKGLTFASGLRSIVRQDPDVIMVGEIRDLETARIAIQASLTGHLVFSTLHTNDAPGAITRLLDIGVESYLVASSVLAVIAQRLVRRICLGCRISYRPCLREVEDLGLSGEEELYCGEGCEVCLGTGYEGRTAIYEIFEVDEGVKSEIVRQVPSSLMKARAVEEGKLETLRQGAIRKMLEGVTTSFEVQRVTQGIDV